MINYNLKNTDSASNQKTVQTRRVSAANGYQATLW